MMSWYMRGRFWKTHFDGQRWAWEDAIQISEAEYRALNNIDSKVELK